MKLRQYEQGKKWADAVASLAGIEGLNRVWVVPDALPSADELQHPARWLAAHRATPPDRGLLSAVHAAAVALVRVRHM